MTWADVSQMLEASRNRIRESDSDAALKEHIEKTAELIDALDASYRLRSIVQNSPVPTHDLRRLQSEYDKLQGEIEKYIDRQQESEREAEAAPEPGGG